MRKADTGMLIVLGGLLILVQVACLLVLTARAGSGETETVRIPVDGVAAVEEAPAVEVVAAAPDQVDVDHHAGVGPVRVDEARDRLVRELVLPDEDPTELEALRAELLHRFKPADVIQHLYADRIVWPYEPRLIVFYAGDNDLHAGKTPEEVADQAAFVPRGGEFEGAGLGVAVCNDFPGRIVDRLLRPYLNAALRRLDEGLATADDMDTTLRLGLGYPEGPIALLERTGLAAHFDVAQALYEALGDPAYAPARRARVAKMRT